MFIKPGVFDGHQGLLQEDRYAIDGHPISFFREDPTDKPPLVVKDLDGYIMGRQRREGGDLFLAPGGKFQSQGRADYIKKSYKLLYINACF